MALLVKSTEGLVANIEAIEDNIETIENNIVAIEDNIETIEQEQLTQNQEISETNVAIDILEDKLNIKLVDKSIYANFSNVAWLTLQYKSYFSALGSEVTNFASFLNLLPTVTYFFEITSERIVDIRTFYKDTVRVYSNEDPNIKDRFVFRIGDIEEDTLLPTKWQAIENTLDLSSLATKDELIFYSNLAIQNSLKAQVGELYFNYDNQYKDALSFTKLGIEYLLCDGRVLNVLDYPDLAAALNVAVTETTFNLPNFLDGTIRHLQAGNARALGSYEEDAMQPIVADICQGQWGNDKAPQPPFLATSVSPTLAWQGINSPNYTQGWLKLDTSTVVRTADETRMKNTAVQFYIKAKVVGGASLPDMPNIIIK